MNYYKILSEDENHHGLQFRTGLNKLPEGEKFNPSGNCMPGGIYFSSKDILAFISWGPWIRKVTLPEGTQVYKNPGTPVKWKADKVILEERKEITLDVIRELVEEGADIHANDDAALRWAAAHGHLDVVKVLVEVGANIHAKDDEALRWAAAHGHLDIVKYLVEAGADIHANDDYALRWAAVKGYLDIVEILKEAGDKD